MANRGMCLSGCIYVSVFGVQTESITRVVYNSSSEKLPETTWLRRGLLGL